MSSWPTVALDDVFEIARGGSPRPIDAYLTDDPNGVNWVMIGDASESSKYITRTRKRIRQDGVKRSRKVNPGDFLLTNSMSFGRPYIMATHGCIHDGWLVLSAKRRDVDSDFLYHLLGSDAMYAEFERRASGVTVKNLNIDLVRSVQIPFPPISEQRRIARILDCTDALRAKRRAALAEIRDLTDAIFNEMFGGPGFYNARIPVGKLGDVATFTGGGTPSRDRPDFYQGDICWATSKDMKHEFLSDTEEHITRQAIKESATNLVEQGTILIVVKSKILARELPVAIAKTPTCFGQDLKGITVSEGFEPPYVAAALRSGKKWLLERARGVNTEGLTLEHLRAFPLPLPSQQAQLEFSKRIDAVSHLKAVFSSSQQHLDSLFVSLQHGAFRGEL